MEEIDIIELFKRVKEGKAPKEIEILGICYVRNTDEDKDILDYMYKGDTEYWTCETQVDIDTKIKILDKPIIEEIGKGEYEIDCSNPVKLARGLENIQDKINEIIKWINKENKDE